ncbi:multicopper oxidase [Thozetella sp. PMI_491]|nr:multicopper oxidase [Thozetella sp. PMI_491]
MMRPLALLLGVAALLPSTLGFKSSLPPCTGPRTFELTLTWEDHAPDGFSRKMILINGEFPGPLLEINQGDEVQVTVRNEMPFNTTMHFHGIEMEGTPWSDGVPGVSQRQIASGDSFLYQWTATQYGSYWYHAHQRGQLDDGQYGPIIIRPKKSVQNPFSFISEDSDTLLAIEKAIANVAPLVLSDFRHVTSDDGWAIETASAIELPCYDSILINGEGKVDCWSPEKIASLLSPQQKLFLQIANVSSFTPKACLPKEIIAGVLAAGMPTNLSAVPPEIFDVCTPTNGSRAVIEVEKTKCDKETWLALDVIGTFGLMTVSFSIDELPVYVYAVDGEYIVPQLVEAIGVTNGDRYSILVKLENAGDYTIRVASTAAAQMVAGYATLSYRRDDQDPFTRETVGYIDEVGVNTTADVVFYNQGMQKAYPPSPISQTADQTFRLELAVAGASYQWALNGSVYPAQLDNENPLLFSPQPDLMNNVTITTMNNTWVDLIFVTKSFPMPAHPIHKHGNKMWQIGAGTGAFNYTSVADAIKAMPQNFNLVDPPRRDTLATPPANTEPAWMVVRYHVTNPGAWLLHCHIQSHLLGGMSMVIQDGVDHWPTVPQDYLDFPYQHHW